MEQLKTKNAGVYSFERPIKYTKAYDLTREYVESFFVAYQGPLSGWGITSTLYSDEKYGEIGVELHDTLSPGPSYYLNYHIAQVDEEKTRIDCYYRFGLFSAHAKNAERYIDEHMNSAQR